MKPLVKQPLALALAAMMAALPVFVSPSLAATVRLKDITHIKGIRDNQLVGYGIVVGLDKSGDKSRSTQMSQRNLLMSFGTVLESANDIKNNNSAAVIVTAIIPPFAKAGDKIDVTVSSMADAKSLEGGVLVQTQLLGPNGEVVALAQGPVSTGGTSVESSGSSKRTSITTSGRIPSGAIVEREIQTQIGDESGIELVLNRADFSMANRVASLINTKVAPAMAEDAGAIRVEFPEAFMGNRVALISALENLEVETTVDVAKVVINERTGTIVIGNAVRLQPAAVAHGGITVSIESSNTVSQPTALSAGGNTMGVANANISIEKAQGSLIQLKANSSLQDLVGALNALGVTPSDLISILQALKSAGSLDAELQII